LILLAEIKDLLGHSSITVTQRYAQLAEEALHSIARKTTGGSHN
jgi:site-specific recombinase XerD